MREYMYIPIYKPEINGNEKKYVNECFESSWISSKGKFINEFENQFKNFTGNDYAASVCNGTVALHLALIALGIGPGDEVIVPTLTYIASVNAITYTGATPVFVDSLQETWQIDPNDIINKITCNTKAIMVVHLYGHPCDMDSIMKIAKDKKLYVIEDCAEAFGSKYNDIHVGNFGDISTYSFFGNKTITTGEGGMVVTNDPTLHDRVVHYRGQGLAKNRQYWHDVVGYNYRMTNICAAIGLAQLEHANEIIRKKRLIAQWYKEELTNSSFILHHEVGNVYHSYWMNSILVNRIEQRDALRLILENNEIETRPVFYPVHTMPMYVNNFQRFQVAENIGWKGINLPSWPGLTKEMINHICKIIISFNKNEK